MAHFKQFILLLKVREYFRVFIFDLADVLDLVVLHILLDLGEVPVQSALYYLTPHKLLLSHRHIPLLNYVSHYCFYYSEILFGVGIHLVKN